MRLTCASRVLGSVIALALAITFVSCSGNEEGESVRPGERIGPVEATTTTEPSFSGVGNEHFCARARTASERLSELVRVETSPGSARTLFTTAATTVRSLAEAAPAEIATDARAVASAYSSFVERMSKVDWRPDRLPEEIALKLDAPGVRVAVDRLQAYERRICGIGG